MFVSCVEISDQVVPVTLISGEECCKLLGPLRGELYYRLAHVYWVKDCSQVLFIVLPDHEHVIYVPPPNCRFVLLPATKVGLLICP